MKDASFKMEAGRRKTEEPGHCLRPLTAHSAEAGPLGGAGSGERGGCRATNRATTAAMARAAQAAVVKEIRAGLDVLNDR